MEKFQALENFRRKKNKNKNKKKKGKKREEPLNQNKKLPGLLLIEMQRSEKKLKLPRIKKKF